MGAFRPGKNVVSIVAAAAIISMISGCQNMDATTTNSVSKPVVYSLRSKPAVQAAYAMPTAHSLRIEPSILATSTTRITGRGYAFASPQQIKAHALDPVKVSFNPVGGGKVLGGSPYICSPSGFGQRASCHARYL
ncbi:MAG: hypothetical protein E5V49_05450 [Mesorhizobium sp.]|nr:hypothetical protein EN848_21130 [bacterium M00.F.Ca.ET.205.01.1.1]TGU51041.1 hypothetical protein EN795_20675 [bacterium M00.F.Ca.ET.152.01.1.1]TGV34534.1 hypothetical protein EN829_018625 [Mesorhizobium sp. M00.F.Ca.ET.186.01.1.1]TGZ42168.1 hypothetical protein EN805_17420 [bacterium M00.F.Ca.ET.162.01.1.1]TIW60926.1 MAG: hypothetical protein E5V48_11540 [Mesorhizobium sp.]